MGYKAQLLYATSKQCVQALFCEGFVFVIYFTQALRVYPTQFWRNVLIVATQKEAVAAVGAGNGVQKVVG